MSHKLKLLALNVRGLRNTSKRRAIFSYLKAQKATIFCLQETYSLIEDEKVWSAEWGNNILFSHGSAHSRGVCILQNPCSTSVRLCSISTDAEGRLIIAKVIIENKPFFILNIYATTDYRDQDNFIKTISEHLASKTDTSKVIISGDWNTTLNQIDKSGGQPWKATNYRNALVSLMEEINLVDVYRQLQPTTKSFTYESKPLKVGSRIDFFLISRPLSNHVRKTETPVTQ